MRLSIVTTLYRSAPFIREFYRRVSAAASTVTGEYEIIFVNDGSPDESLELATQIVDKDSRVRVVDLSRNFGHHRAIMTGLGYARGDRVLVIDCDLEEEPEHLEQFWREMEAGDADVIYGVQSDRKGRWLERVSGRVFSGFSTRSPTTPCRQIS